MESTGGSDVGMQVEDGGTASLPSDLISSKASTAAHPFFCPGWDSLVLLNHSENFLSRNEPFASNFCSVGNQVIGGSSFLFTGQPITDSRLACFGNRDLSEAVVGSFSVSEFIGISDSGCLPNFGSYMNDGGISEMSMREGVKSHECQNLEDGAGGDSPMNGMIRKRSPDSRSHDLSESNHNKLQGNRCGKSLDASNAQVEKKQKRKRNEGPNNPKQSTRQAKDNLSWEEAPKEYVHVRARRGQATNSHSLAERIRREKISERMRLLQELVPGCSKITGKAVMLDEIINYVQSLQQQVEFLSMKLATIIPDLCFDAARPSFPMDINSQHTDATAPGLGNPRLGSFQHFSPGMSKGNLPISPSAAQYLSLSQLPLDSEFQLLYHTGFDSISADIPKAEGHPKQEE